MLRHALVLLAATASGAAAQTPPAIDSLYAAFSRAYQTTDADLIRSLYTDDCRYLPAAESAGVQTCGEAMAGFARMFSGAAEAGRQIDIAFRFVDRGVEGDLAYDVGFYRVTTDSGEGPPRANTGKFVTVLRRGAGGRWRIHVDGFSPATADQFEAAGR